MASSQNERSISLIRFEVIFDPALPQSALTVLFQRAFKRAQGGFQCPIDSRSLRALLQSASALAATMKTVSTQCGAGQPRYNVVARQGLNDPTFHFIGGCANGVPTPAPQDPTEWTRVRFANSAATAFPPIPPGSNIESIDLIVDEGTDAPSLE